MLREFVINVFHEISTVTQVEGTFLVNRLARELKKMSRRECCVWGCSNRKGKCPEDIAGNRLCGCHLPRNEGCPKREYLTLHGIHNMSEPVRRSVIEKINHTRQGLQRTKWQPSKEAVICNVHYADFKGPTRVNPDVLPIYFKRPSSYPAATSAPKQRRLLERRPPPVKATRSRVIDHSQHTQHSSEDSVNDHHAHHNMEITDSEQNAHQNTEISNSEQHAHHNMEITDSEQNTHQNTEISNSEQNAHHDTEISNSEQHAHHNMEITDSEQNAHHNTEISNSEQNTHHDMEISNNEQHAHHNTEITDSEQNAHHNTEISNSEQNTHHDMEISNNEQLHTTTQR